MKFCTILQEERFKINRMQPGWELIEYHLIEPGAFICKIQAILLWESLRKNMYNIPDS